MAALQQALPEITAAGATLVVLSPQVAPSPREAGVQHPDQAYELLIDRGNEVARRFRLVFPLPDALREIYRKIGIDLEVANGDASWTLPMPARYLVDRQGVVRAADVHPDYTRRTEPAATLAALRALAR
ncbi:MAG: redoxin domain-containing protein [Candidatus Rokubacteria bacterium]|nr:redoxin domain-containing protein [Candidatus Rokubacteria bacterium]